MLGGALRVLAVLACAAVPRAHALQTPRSSAAPQRQQLYEAYNLLHNLAADFNNKIESPAVLVVGQQTSGKSALIEGLLGFQFNHVGGGTKTRRPIALRMQYNPACTEPVCYLGSKAGKEQRLTLAEVQAFIESENRRLEQDPVRCFSHEEIHVRMEYRFCPNMIVIDTPGLISSPAVKTRTANPQQRALAHVAQEVKNLVLTKMKCQDYVILCVDDTTDWKHAMTRNLVLQADPDLSRTVVVNTKLDTKLLQFGAAEDIHEFLKASLLSKLFPQMLGGPFFTSVPCGRVGDHSEDCFPNNEAFVQAVRHVEGADSAVVTSKLGKLTGNAMLHRTGISKLRDFLEARVEDSYRRNVARIVPLLQGEMRAVEQQLSATTRELDALSIDHLKRNANLFREHFVQSLQHAIQGTIVAPPSIFGENLQAETLQAGAFFDPSEVDPLQWEKMTEHQVGNVHNRLYGGAQYHRALREFAAAVKHMHAPEISQDEIANAAGVGDMHDGMNFMRAACVIAVQKAQQSFEPLLEALRQRSVHIMKRLYPITDFMLQKSGVGMSESHNKPFHDVVLRIYDEFVDKTVETCLERCYSDLKSMTRFVTWDLNERGSGAVSNSIAGSSLVQIYSMTLEAQHDRTRRRASSGSGAGSGSARISQRGDEDHSALEPWEQESAESGMHQDQRDLMQLVTEATTMRSANQTFTIITTLVQHIVQSWRQHFAQSVAMKFNCFFLMKFVDDFPAYLREELDLIYENGDLERVFNIGNARELLETKRETLLAARRDNVALQEKFASLMAALEGAP